MLLARAKPIINDMAILHEAVQYLKTKAPSSEIDNLNKKTDDIEDKTFTLSMAELKNEITQEMIEDLRNERLSNFLESDYYKELLKKIQAGQDTIKTGQFLLKFDNKYLTPKKALRLDVGNKGSDGVCEVMNDHLPYGKQVKFDGLSGFSCPINYVSGGLDFKDRDITFPKDSCNTYEPNTETNFDNVSIHYEINGDEAKVHFESKFDMAYFHYDCNGYHTVKPENKETDLPLFHIEDINIALIVDMKYHLIAAEEKDMNEDIWNVEKAAESDEYFHITNMAKEDRKLCMYDFKGYYSVVIDKAPEDHTECQWFKKNGI